MSDDTMFPVLPYTQEGQPSAGYARGADTSRDSMPERAGNQRRVLDIVARSGWQGVVGHEVNEALGKPRKTTGQACLSVLHREGYIARLVDKRNGQKIYVLPEFVGIRATELVGRHGAGRCWNCDVEL